MGNKDYFCCSFVSDPDALVNDFESLLLYELTMLQFEDEQNMLDNSNAIHQVIGFTECMHSLGILTEEEAFEYQLKFRELLSK